MTQAPDPQALLCFNLYAASHAFTRFYQPILEPLGLTYPQYLVLLALGRDDGRGVGALGEELMLDTNTLSPLLKRMEALGLVSRTRMAEDERRVMVQLTDSGKALAIRAAAIPECIATCLDLPGEEIAGVTQILHRLRDVLRQTPPPSV
ncbi:MarR family transcriptional regulator [Gemmobacter fulvus]|uniref:MarR family winged helix-turn-helix transcriptional regulator n=1 Tax=Gemmobacter fulvus TaxID=2840474 RepID=UPI0027967486|nr:MarR family transcriptional regulator [Gemmobacter fulvus]MDQ1850276.1 MarR family transcriptional regulator [Gemmobacter fulvus]